jgi:hypothetical protein
LDEGGDGIGSGELCSAWDEDDASLRNENGTGPLFDIDDIDRGGKGSGESENADDGKPVRLYTKESQSSSSRQKTDNALHCDV